VTCRSLLIWAESVPVAAGGTWARKNPEKKTQRENQKTKNLLNRTLAGVASGTCYCYFLVGRYCPGNAKSIFVLKTLKTLERQPLDPLRGRPARMTIPFLKSFAGLLRSNIKRSYKKNSSS
jgi:hypothetical protein